MLFLTGTPMENKVGEFRVLVGHLRPEIAERVSGDNGAFGTELRKRIIDTEKKRFRAG
ncbi:MAG TPA: hypothetical protein VGG75_25115 [Trebonia sp.]